jgi:glycine cleavage system aminomethyltransferase T
MITARLAWRVSERKTPLYDEHVRLGAKMVPFAGWLMPVQYTSIVEEHQAVRNNVGVFDISHMGQFLVDGADARDWLNSVLTNNVEKLDVGTGQYTFLLNDRGGIIDDLIIYRIDEQKYLLVVNAARADEDFAWLQDHLKEGRSPDRPSGGLETAAPWVTCVANPLLALHRSRFSGNEANLQSTNDASAIFEVDLSRSLQIEFDQL